MSREENLIKLYLNKLGLHNAIESSLEMLQEIQHRHVLTIPFENLNSFSGKGVSMHTEDLADKLLLQKRGGYCFEHNTLLLKVLEQAGIPARPLAARVVWHGQEYHEIPRTHMLLLVSLPEGDFVMDTGFGQPLTSILRLQPGLVQQSPLHKYRIDQEAQFYTLSVLLNNEWKPQYVFDLSTQYLADFELSNWFVSTHPQSRFVKHLVLAMPGNKVMHTLFDNVYTRYPLGDEKQQTVLGSSRQIRSCLEDVFGLDLEDITALDVKLESLFV